MAEIEDMIKAIQQSMEAGGGGGSQESLGGSAEMLAMKEKLEQRMAQVEALAAESGSKVEGGAAQGAAEEKKTTDAQLS